MPDITSPVEEPTLEDATQVFESVIQMTADRVQRLAKHKKYVIAASSFPSYNIGQEFTRGANDISMVSFSSHSLLRIIYQVLG